MKRTLLILLAACSLAVAADEDPGDWSYNAGNYAVNSSFPYESAQLVGPDFQEGTTILRHYVQGQLESDASFQFRLKRIVDALAATQPVQARKARSKR